METTMYDTLLQLPLFQGLCKDDLTTIIEKVKLHFLNYEAGETFIRKDEKCDKFVFLLSGTIKLEAEEPTYTLSETIEEPGVIEPQSMFGIQTIYTANYITITPSKLLTIDKCFVLQELMNYEIFRLNYLNILSSRIQMANQKLWNARIGTMREKFINFIQARCQKPRGEKTLRITMKDLAFLTNEPTLKVSQMLNGLQKEGLIQLSRKEIYIPAFEKLLQEPAI